VSALYVAGCWVFGLAWIGLLSALAGAERPWVTHLARGIYTAGIAVILVVTVVIVAAANAVAISGPSRSGIWTYALGSAIPVTLLGFVTMRRVFPRPWVTGAATLPAIAFLVGSAAAFRPKGVRLDGLAETAHDHHALVVAALLTVIGLPSATLVLPRAVKRERSTQE
jgi:hypothetical protein